MESEHPQFLNKEIKTWTDVCAIIHCHTFLRFVFDSCFDRKLSDKNKYTFSSERGPEKATMVSQ